MDPIARHSYVQINGSFVHLLQYGFGESIFRSPSAAHDSQVSSSFSTQSVGSGSYLNATTSDTSAGNAKGSISEAPKKIIIFIPGNPGVLGVYHDFLVSLFRTIAGSTMSLKNRQNAPTLVAISHNNFDHPENVQYRAEERICVGENDVNFVERSLAKNYANEPHHIELQVLNKLVILKRLLKVNIDSCKFIFMGHSIGCYIALRLLQDRVINSAHEGSIMIHPALENLALTEKGSLVNTFFNYKFDLLLRPLVFLIDKLPRQTKLAIVKWMSPSDFVQNCSEIVLDSIAQLGCQKAHLALIQFAKSELALVKNLNTDLIKPHASKLKLIYAIDDYWVNTDSRRMLRDMFPELHIEEHSTMHAFVMYPNIVMDYAVKVGLLIQDMLDNIDQEQEKNKKPQIRE